MAIGASSEMKIVEANICVLTLGCACCDTISFTTLIRYVATVWFTSNLPPIGAKHCGTLAKHCPQST